MKLKTQLLMLLLFSGVSSFAQVYTDKIVGEKNEALRDSLETYKYPYTLPIWGEEVAQKGYDLPYSGGISANFFWQKSDLIINNLNVGFNNGTQYDLKRGKSVFIKKNEYLGCYSNWLRDKRRKLLLSCFGSEGIFRKYKYKVLKVN